MDTIKRRDSMPSAAGEDGIADQRTVRCSGCGEMKLIIDFSKNQLRKNGAARCKPCVERGRHTASSSSHPVVPSIQLTSIEIQPRPQRDVPGFEGALTCCTDWPRTKSGAPPSAQSAVFMPLLAMVVGPVEGYCTAEQLEFAERWWTEALPSWPIWIRRLRDAGVQGRRDDLVSKAKGNPNPLIPRAKGRGTVPHFRGWMQSAAIESDPSVALELYACIACLYSSNDPEREKEDSRDTAALSEEHSNKREESR